MSGFLGFGKSSSRQKINELPGLFNTKQGRESINRGVDLGETNLFPGLNEGENRIGDELQSQLLAPKFGADTKSEVALLNSIRDFTQGNAATRGLDVTAESLAQSIAPQLIQLRQQDIGNLQNQQGLNTASISDLINTLIAKGQLGQKQRIVTGSSNAFNFQGGGGIGGTGGGGG